MSLKYVLHLTAPERQALTRIAKGRGEYQHPTAGQVERARALLKCDAGPTGAGWTDEAIATALDVLAGNMGRWRCQAAPRAAKTARHLRLRIRAAWRLRRLAVRGTAEPVAHRQRYRSAHGGGLGAPGAGRSRPSALPLGRVPDAGVQPPERP